MRRIVLTLACASFVGLGCSSPDTGGSTRRAGGGAETPAPSPGGNDVPPAPSTETPPPAGTTIGDETWSDGKQIASNITIGAGKTVVISPGAKITVAAGVAITVQGTLRATTSATHASIVGPAGGSWTGLVVASGGTLTADSLDITGATKALWTLNGNTDATFANGAITADTPFTMEAGSKLSISKSTVTAKNPSALAGTFSASYMTYDKGTAEGLYMNDAAGTATIVDSTLKGNGGGDYVVSSAAKLIDVSYTTITGSHCPLHFNAVDKFRIDHVSNLVNGYGPMFYGSGAGPNVISNSNLQDLTYDWDVQNANGTITIDKSYAPGQKTVDAMNTAKVTVTNPVAAAVADAKPH